MLDPQLPYPIKIISHHKMNMTVSHLKVRLFHCQKIRQIKDCIVGKQLTLVAKPKFKFNTRHENCGIQFMQSTKLLSNCNTYSSTVHDSYFMGNKPKLKQIGS